MIKYLANRHGPMSAVSIVLIIFLGACSAAVASRLLGVENWLYAVMIGLVVGSLVSGTMAYLFLLLLERDLQRKDPWRGSK